MNPGEPAGTVPDLLRNAVRRVPDRPAVVAGGRSITFRELDERAERLATALTTKAGLRPGDRFALLAMNELEYIEIQVAAMRAGVALVPLNYRLTVAELEFIWQDCEPKLLISTDAFADKARALGAARHWHLGEGGPGESYDEVLAGTDVTGRTHVLDADRVCSIMYTSGTTGRPKGAASVNAAHWARANTYAIDMAIEPDEVFLQPLPIFHVASNICHAFMARGATSVLLRHFDPGEVIDAVKRHGATRVFLVPTMIHQLCRHPEIARLRSSPLSTVMYGAAPITQSLLVELRAKMPCRLWQGFGMTEAGLLAVLPPADHEDGGRPEVLQSVGHETFGIELRVLGEDGRAAPPAEIGEVVARGPGLASMYWSRPAETERAFDGGWFHTGDVGYFDDDGFLYLTGRKNEMIISGGENVYPREVEEVLTSDAAVAEAAVVGLSDDRWGERVTAFLVLNPGHTLDQSRLEGLCRSRLAGYKVPRGWHVIDELPRNATGKVLRRVLRESSQPASEPPTRPAASLSPSLTEGARHGQGHDQSIH